MIIIARNFGQLGNRLMLAANLIAAAIEYDVQLFNPSFAEYARYFRSTEKDLFCRFPAIDQAIDASVEAAEIGDLVDARPDPSRRSRALLYHPTYLFGRLLSHLRLTRFPFHVIRLGHSGYCDLTSETFERKAKSRRPLFASGWYFDAGPLLTKHADTIRTHFRLISDHENNVAALMNDIRSAADYVVGMHIRHGDYKTFLDGKYYYSITQYVDAMKRIEALYPDRKVTFLVCGNTDLQRSDFGELNVRFGTGHIVEDMYSFAQCDRIIGPPSTYTGWAAFYGGVPLQFMHTADQAFDCDETLGSKSTDCFNRVA